MACAGKHPKSNGSGLTLKQPGATPSFSIAGADRKFYWATTKLEGNNLVLTSPQVAAPVAVRYAWSNNPFPSLHNHEGLPASPFRTDNWPAVTKGKE